MTPAPAPPKFVALADVAPPDATWAWYQSQQASNIAAGKQPAQLGVQVEDPAALAQEFPMVLYNKAKRLAKIAKDKDEKDKLEKDGYGEDPFPPEDPNALSQDDIKQLDAALHTVAEMLPKLAKAAGGDEQKSGDKGKPAAPPVKK